MSRYIGITLILLITVLLGWLLATLDYSLAIPMAVLTPVFNVTGIVLSIRAVRSGEQKIWAWILFSLHTVVFLFYAVAFIYLVFFWNPRFF